MSLYHLASGSPTVAKYLFSTKPRSRERQKVQNPNGTSTIHPHERGNGEASYSASSIIDRPFTYHHTTFARITVRRQNCALVSSTIAFLHHHIHQLLAHPTFKHLPGRLGGSGDTQPLLKDCVYFTSYALSVAGYSNHSGTCRFRDHQQDGPLVSPHGPDTAQPEGCSGGGADASMIAKRIRLGDDLSLRQLRLRRGG